MPFIIHRHPEPPEYWVEYLARLTRTLISLEKLMSAQADALSAQVAHTQTVLAAFLAKFNDLVTQLGNAAGDEAAMAKAVSDLQAAVAPLEAITNPPA
jgi:hypothetical protein